MSLFFDDSKLFFLGLYRRRLKVAHIFRLKCKHFVSDALALMMKGLHYEVLIWLYERSWGLFGRMRLSALRQDHFARVNYNCLGIPFVEKSHSRLWREKTLLDMLLRVKNRSLIHELEQCGRKLRIQIDAISADPRPILLAPLHMCSDTCVALVTARAVGGSLTVVSDEVDKLKLTDHYHDEINGHIRLNFVSPLHLNIKNFVTILRNIRQKRGWFAIFPDALPEMTSKMFNVRMRTKTFTLFNRQALLHSGFLEIAKMMNARVFVYGLVRKKGGFDIDVLGCLDCNSLEHDFPKLFELALIKHAPSWLLWHFPSLFYFSADSDF